MALRIHSPQTPTVSQVGGQPAGQGVSKSAKQRRRATRTAWRVRGRRAGAACRSFRSQGDARVQPCRATCGNDARDSGDRQYEARCCQVYNACVTIAIAIAQTVECMGLGV
jgi:hypothetical protein